MKAPSESTLKKYFRLAVRKKRGNQCNWPDCPLPADHVHHYVHSRYLLLRYDAENGVPLCAHHHAEADTMFGREILRDVVNMSYLLDVQKLYPTAKDWYVKHGMTRAEFLHDELEELKRVAK